MEDREEIPDVQPCRQVSHTENVLRRDLIPDTFNAMLTNECFNHYNTGSPEILDMKSFKTPSISPFSSGVKSLKKRKKNNNQIFLGYLKG